MRMWIVGVYVDEVMCGNAQDNIGGDNPNGGGGKGGAVGGDGGGGEGDSGGDGNVDGTVVGDDVL